MKDDNPFARAFPFLLAWAAFLWCAMIIGIVICMAVLSPSTIIRAFPIVMGGFLVIGVVPIVGCAAAMLLHDELKP